MPELVTKQTGKRSPVEIKDGFALLDLARGWLKQGNPVVAMELMKSAKASAEAALDQDLRAHILKENGRALMMQSDWENAEMYYLEAQRIFLQVKNMKGASECARNRANMYVQRGMFREAENLCEQALEWALTLKEHQLRATILNTLGAIKSATGETSESIKIFKLCLADFQAAGNTIRQGYVLLNIGLSQTELGEYPEAIRSLNESLAVALTEKDLHLVEICYQNIAKCHLAQNETVLARSVLDTARKILPGLDSRALEAELELINCRILKIMGDIEGAEVLLKKTYQVATEYTLTSLQADVLFEQGLLYKESGSPELAACKLAAAAHQYRQAGVDKGFKEAIQFLNQVKRGANA
ncbi:tetratricopeptide repeat protein [Candidatus Zixiibacteriota bacterium]